MLQLIIKKESLDRQTLSSLPAIEQAFISACHSDQLLLADELLAAAKSFLYHERFQKSKNYEISLMRNKWKTFEYKLELLKILKEADGDQDKFEKKAFSYRSEFDGKIKEEYDDDFIRQRSECERFRRYITAIANLKENPSRSIAILEQLCREINSDIYNYQLFASKLAVLGEVGGEAAYRSALSGFLSQVEHVTPDSMPHTWVAAILNCLLKLKNHQKIDDFWEDLTYDQKLRLEAIRPYCSSLIARGEPDRAREVLSKLKRINPDSIDEFRDLIDDIYRATPAKQSASITEMVELVNTVNQKNISYLIRSYKDITSRNFREYIEIVCGERVPVHCFLKYIIIEISNELLLRKKNLQIHEQTSIGKASFRITLTKEDLINDWFTSLFDKRMADARVGFRDQKRGGKSSSGKEPGEVDGYITDAKNTRIAIFEAFRLFSNDSTVIFKHLNKIVGYDNESLNVVIIMAYCSVNNFKNHCNEYFKSVSSNQYVGFQFNDAGQHKIKNLLDDACLKVGVEVRRREAKEITIYHFLLDMYFD